MGWLAYYAVRDRTCTTPIAMSSVVLVKQLMDRGNLSDSDIAVIYKAVDKDHNRQATFDEIREFVQRYGYPSMTTKELLK